MMTMISPSYQVGKVLQNLFNFRQFTKQEKYMMPLNSFIEKNKPTVEHYFNSLVKVDDPEDHLQVNKYMELTQKTKPVILISLHEISATHNLLLQNLDALATEKEDELKVILNDLGEAPPEIDDSDDREIQLTLTNRFKVAVEGMVSPSPPLPIWFILTPLLEEDEVERMYAETKELIIPVLSTIPIETSIHRLHLTVSPIASASPFQMSHTILSFCRMCLNRAFVMLERPITRIFLLKSTRSLKILPNWKKLAGYPRATDMKALFMISLWYRFFFSFERDYC